MIILYALTMSLFMGKKDYFFSVTDLLYYEQRNYVSGITIC